MAQSDHDELVLLESNDGIATVTLNRPEARNALSSALRRRLREVMAAIDSDDAVSAVILTGADPAFCAGLDLKELSERGRLDQDPDDAGIQGLPWAPLKKPLIGAVNGVAITGGFELALNCDFLIASERAAFADTHARVGILPGWGLSVLLPQRIGFAMARRMSFTGDFLPAQRALECGLVTEVVPHDELLTAARRAAAAIVSNNKPAVEALLASYRRIEAAAAGDGMALEAAASRDWARGGGTEGLAERVGGVFERGRSQMHSRETQNQ
ncbi:MAG TPA: enoyl-CoA hydratase [Acidimicrobiales bacterium]|nr:enoyl-CoA hydratase [Acidimicrobiales bacterium]